MSLTKIFLAGFSAAFITTTAQARIAFFKEECPSGYSRVPRNAAYVPSDFCVMKYEARARNSSSGAIDADGCNEPGCTTADWGLATNIPYSTDTGIGWRMISQTNAKAMCRSLGPRYDLISNAEWQTVARNTELVNRNWSGGTVGSGCMFVGNSNNNSTCGYAGSQPEGGTGRNQKARLFLSNGQEVWDMAGNLKEWVLDDNSTNYGSDAYTYAVTSGTHTTPGILNDKVSRTAKDQFGPSGTYASCAANERCGLGHVDLASPTGALQRGGRWEGDWTGIFSVGYFTPGSNTQFGWGFRCAYHPKDVKVIFLTDTTQNSWTVPNDWSNLGNSIEVIGGGGGGGRGGLNHGGRGGGGGGYSKIYNLSLTPGNSVTYQIGTGGIGGTTGNADGGGGTDTFFNGSGTTCANSSPAVCASAGSGGPGDTIGLGALGGASANGVITGTGGVKYSGGRGGRIGSDSGGGAGGGGGAGPFGNAGNGGAHYNPTDTVITGGGGGGGGNGGGGAGVPTATDSLIGGNGGTGQDGTAGGVGSSSTGTPGAAGSRGSGGGGGAGGNTVASDGGTGGAGVDFDATHGSGGGGGGGGGTIDWVGTARAGGDGGLYGGGGAGGGWQDTIKSQSHGGAGAPGIIVITYTPR